MESKDFSYMANHIGYRVFYKGRPIGGSGIIPTHTMHWRHRQRNTEEFTRLANRDIDQILAGRGRRDMVEIIKGLEENV